MMATTHSPLGHFAQSPQGISLGAGAGESRCAKPSMSNDACTQTTTRAEDTHKMQRMSRAECLVWIAMASFSKSLTPWQANAVPFKSLVTQSAPKSLYLDYNIYIYIYTYILWKQYNVLRWRSVDFDRDSNLGCQQGLFPWGTPDTAFTIGTTSPV